MKQLLLKLLPFSCIFFLTFVTNASEECVKVGEICGSTNQSGVLYSCCDGLKCVTTQRATGVTTAFVADIVYPFKCLNCVENFSDRCGGADKLECCPMTGYCVLTNYSDPNSYGRCIPPV